MKMISDQGGEGSESLEPKRRCQDLPHPPKIFPSLKSTVARHLELNSDSVRHQPL